MEPFHTIATGTSVGPIRRLLGRIFVFVVGWRVESHVPETTCKAVVIAAPHTTYWDGVMIVGLSWAMGVRLSWMVKDAAYRWPFRFIMDFVGALPVNRSSPRGIVGSVAKQLKEADAMYLAVAPSGTRRKVKYWKSGFYRIAREAGVPLVFGFVEQATERHGVA